MSSRGKPNIKGKLELMHLIEQLKLQKRTGWVREGVKGPESIADHMYRMAMLSLLSEEDEDLDIGKCVQLAVVHDLAEASVGDITPFDGVTKEVKQKLEEVRFFPSFLPSAHTECRNTRTLFITSPTTF